jgi:hypothetical protein
MTVTYEALAVGIFLIGAIFVVAILFWKRLRAVEARLRTIRREINGLHVQESRRFVMELNANPKLEASKIAPQDGSAEVDRGEIVPLRRDAELTASLSLV